MFKSILAAAIYEADLEIQEPAHHVVDFATQLASRHGAHLAIAVGACRLSVPSLITFSEAKGLVGQANDERERDARAFSAELLRSCAPAGVSAASHFLHGDFQALTASIVALARTSDITLMQPSDEAFSISQGVLEETLFTSGRPVIVVPAGATAGFEKVVLAWDGSGKAARAIGDAVPFIEGADEVEIVTVAGDPNRRKHFEGADIAPHMARHARQVRITNLTCTDGDIARVLSEHAAMTRAGLLVMGAYGHSRVREFVLGGVTRAMLRHPSVPVLMSF